MTSGTFNMKNYPLIIILVVVILCTGELCDAFTSSKISLTSRPNIRSYNTFFSIGRTEPVVYINRNDNKNKRSTEIYQSSSQDDSSLESESASSSSASDEVVRELILSLSLEFDDEKRREKLTAILEERLNDNDNVTEAAKFAHLWDTNIIKIGGEIQDEARVEAEERIALLESSSDGEADAKSDTNGDDISNDNDINNDDTNDDVDNENKDDNNKEKVTKVTFKSDKERQLWSMIDMMVQSKSVIKDLTNNQ